MIKAVRSIFLAAGDTPASHSRLSPGEEQDLIATDGSSFTHLDLIFYDNCQRRLENRRFRWLQDLEDLALSRSWTACSGFIRFMVHAEAAIVAGIYHLKPNWWARMHGLKSSKVIDLETQFSDGRWLCTHNAESIQDSPLPPEIDACFFPSNTALEEMLASHEYRIRLHLQQRQGVETLRMECPEDIIRSQMELQQLKRDFRQNPNQPPDDKILPISRETFLQQSPLHSPENQAGQQRRAA